MDKDEYKTRHAMLSGHITQGWSDLLRADTYYNEYQIVSIQCLFCLVIAHAVYIKFSILNITDFTRILLREMLEEEHSSSVKSSVSLAK